MEVFEKNTNFPVPDSAATWEPKNLRPLAVGNGQPFGAARQGKVFVEMFLRLQPSPLSVPGLYPASKGTDERMWRSSKTPNLKENLSKGVLWNR
jgi:hypothetical protein